MNRPQFIDEITRALSAAFPAGITQDIEKNLRQVLQAQLDRMGLVTREELEVQKAILQRTREKIEVLEKTVTELEQKLSQ